MSNVATIRAGLATTLQANVAGLSTSNFFQYAPTDGQTGGNPFGFIRMKRGRISFPRMQGIRETLHEINVYILFSLASGLSDAEKNAEAFVQSVTAAIDLNKTLGQVAGVVEAAITDYEIQAVSLRRDSEERYGLVFTVTVEEVEQGSLMAS